MSNKIILGNRGSGKTLESIKEALATKSILIVKDSNQKKRIEKDYPYNIKVLTLDELKNNRLDRTLEIRQYTDDLGNLKLVLDEALTLLEILLKDFSGTNKLVLENASFSADAKIIYKNKDSYETAKLNLN